MRFGEGAVAALVAVVIAGIVALLASTVTCRGLEDRLTITGHLDSVQVLRSYWVCQ